MICPRCKSPNISFQREQYGNIGVGTNRVVIDYPKQSKGCLYWLCIGWWWKSMYWLFIGWWNYLVTWLVKVGFNTTRG